VRVISDGPVVAASGPSLAFRSSKVEFESTPDRFWERPVSASL